MWWSLWSEIWKLSSTDQFDQLLWITARKCSHPMTWRFLCLGRKSTKLHVRTKQLSEGNGQHWKKNEVWMQRHPQGIIVSLSIKAFVTHTESKRLDFASYLVDFHVTFPLRCATGVLEPGSKHLFSVHILSFRLRPSHSPEFMLP